MERLFVLYFACLYAVNAVTASNNVRHMKMDYANGAGLLSNIEKALFKPKLKPSVGQDFRWKNCRQDDPVQLKSLTLTPDPLQPGNPAQFSVALKVGEQLDSLQPSVGQDFRWKNCRQDDPVQLKSLTLTPDPLQPGNPAQFSVALKVGEQLDSLQAKLQVLQQQGARWSDLCPLITAVGYSCDLDVCALLKMIESCPAELVKAGFYCYCPIKMNMYTLTNFATPAIPSIIGGLFNVTLNLTQKGKNVGCAWAEFRLA